MASAEDKVLRARINKLEAALRKLQDRKAKRLAKRNTPPGLIKIHTYGDNALVTDPEEVDLQEIEEALKD